MSGGGKTQTSTSSVSIPPEVLARYNAVNARAEAVAQTPFTPYGGQFVAPLTGTQQAGIANVSQAAGAAQPYYQAAGASLLGGAAQAQPYYQAATEGLYGGQAAAAPLQTAAAQNIAGAQAGAQPYLTSAQQSLAGGSAQSQGLAAASLQSLYGGQAAASPFQAAAAQNIAGAQAGAQPYQALATGYGMAGARQIAPGGLNIPAYMSPYTEAVAQPTYQALRQQQQQEQQKLLGEQIRAGAFGGDRGRIAQANLAQQQNLATAQALGNIYQQGYGQALGAAQQQQGVALAAEQANRQAQQQAAQQFLGIGQQGFGQGMTTAQQQAALAQQLMGQGTTAAQQQAALGQQLFGQGAQAAQQQAGFGQQVYGMGTGTAQQQAALAQQLYGQGATTAQQAAALGQGLYGIGAGVSQGLAGLGAGAQQAALQGGQAQLAAGTVEQQTQQAQNQALYNQFLQQQGYPFQVAQFLANIAMGTGALSGSTTTTTQPGSFFSDERLKEDVEPIGKTFDGQQIVRFKYKGEPGTRIGLVAQDVEKKHPEAVGLAGGYKTVDYDAATDEAAARAPHKAYGGGLSPWDGSSMGGSVFREDAGQGFAAGGAPGGDDILAQINALVNAHQGMYPYGKTGLYGTGMGKAGPYGSTLMQPQSRGLMRAENVGTRPVSAMEGMESTVRRAENIQKMYEGGKKGINFVKEESQLSPTYTTAGQGPTPSGAALGTPTTIRDQLDAFFGGANRGTEIPTAMYRGGLARSNYAMGGLPYSNAEDEYVPEDVSKPFTPGKLETAKPPGQQSSTGQDLMQFAKIAAMAYGAGASTGGAIRRHYEYGGGLAPDYDGPSMGSDMTPDQDTTPSYGGLAPDPRPASILEGSKKDDQQKVQSAQVNPGVMQPNVVASKDQASEDFQKAATVAALAIMAFSDRRLKDNIEPIGKLFDGQNVYRYNFKGDDKKQIGLMAQEVEKRYPDAVGLAPRKGYQPGGFVVPEGYVDEIVRSESSGQPDATNRNFPVERGGPLGVGQFTRNTWGDFVRANPALFEGKSSEEINAMRADPGLSRQAVEWYARTNAPVLQNAGLDPSVRNLRIAHVQGPGGARALLTNPDINAVDALALAYGGDRARAERALVNNRGAPDMTSAQYVALFDRSAGATPGAAAPGVAPSGGAPQPGYASREDVQSPYMRQALQVLQRASQREKPDWMQRNQDWLVPILTGLGTMASSPSRYLGSAILQGVAGGASAYAGMQKTLEEQRIERERLAQSAVERVTGAGRLDVERLREINTQQQLGLRALQEFIGQYRVTREGGRVVYVGPGGNLLTQEQFQQEKNRIMRQFNLSPEQAATVAPVAPAGQPPAQTNVPGAPAPAPASGAQPPAQAPAAAPSGQAPAPGAQPPAPSTSGLVTPAQQDAIPEPARRNQESVDQQTQLISRLTRDANEAAQRVAELQRDPATRFSPEIGTLQQQINQWNAERMRLEGQEQSTASGVRYVIRPGFVEDYNPPAPVNQAPRAEMNPLTGQISSAPVNVGYRGTGGFPLPNDVPMNNVQITRAPIIERAREASGRAADEFLAQSGRSEDAVQNMFRFATALKILEAGGTTMQRAEISNLMRGLGFDRIADTVQRARDTNAAFVAAKTGIMNAIEVGSQAFPRMTQNEFGTLVSRAVPSADMPPDAVREIMRGQLAATMFTTQLRRDWEAAKEQQGIENFNAFAERWRRQHPPGLFMDSADRLLGNLRGQSLPSVDKLTEGVVYVMPRRMNDDERAISQRFGVGPGELFVVRNLDQVNGRLEFDAQKLPSNVDVFSIYRQAPALRMYGER